ncbi:DUF6377 domain-containing protein [Neptunitalea lumnitzerae]|nr:DUF6377 domain-containing protein [Neptunitalea sp. Y10]
MHKEERRQMLCLVWMLMGFLLLMPITNAYGQDKKLLKELDAVIRESVRYQNDKYASIEKLKPSITQYTYAGNQVALLATYTTLFRTYRSFQYDSAYLYLDKAKQLATVIHANDTLSDLQIEEGFILMSAGLFKEGLDVLESIDVSALDTIQSFKYYNTKARTYFDLAAYTDDDRFSIQYVQKGNTLLNKAIAFTDKDSPEYWSSIALRYLMIRDWDNAHKSFTYWLDNFELSPEAYAIATSSLAYVYEMTGDKDKQMNYLIKAAITDIKHGIKETVALQNLAIILYDKNDVARAYTYISQAMEDASFYNARHRKLTISSILPIIEEAQLMQMEQQKSKLSFVVVILGVLAVLSVVLLLVLIKQLKEKNASRSMLEASNQKLQELNRDLHEVDSIKQEYIAYFLKTSSSLLNKIDSMQKIAHQKVIVNRTSELLKSLRKYNVKNERAFLFQQFDEVFLQLFPSFITRYNELFSEENRIVIAEGKGMNTEVRIFALYRLGVQDSQQVAEFLDLSVNTIYSYKARVKAKSLYKEDFEAKIMEIKQL